MVETTNINPTHGFQGIAPTAALKVTERFSRVDEETFLYEFTVDDPTTYTEPWGGVIPYKRFHDKLFEYAYHEGKYRLGSVLSGARYEERMVSASPYDQPLRGAGFTFLGGRTRGVSGTRI